MTNSSVPPEQTPDTHATCSICNQGPTSGDSGDICPDCEVQGWSLTQLDEFSDDLENSGDPDPLSEVYADHFGKPEPQHTLSPEAALREIAAFPCEAMRDDKLHIEVQRHGEIISTHLFYLPLNGPLALPLRGGDLVLSFHDHHCNRDILHLKHEDEDKAACFQNAGKFLKVIAIE